MHFCYASNIIMQDYVTMFIQQVMLREFNSRSS